jgi:biotin-dependent carboxylase-like uncharacterized protein
LALVVINPGLHTTVQDLGRHGYRASGVPSAGAFDVTAHGLANALLGNPATCATLELTLVGGVYLAEQQLALALAGAPMDARIEEPNGESRPLKVPQSFTLGAGERLAIGGTRHGARTYLAVSGGWDTPIILGSRSSEVPLRRDDRVPAESGSTWVRRPVTLPEDDRAIEGPVHVLPGPDAAACSVQTRWHDQTYRVGSHADRMGIRLEGPALDIPADPVRLSAPVAPGAIQLAGGQLILLGVGCGTMGGYHHIAHVISADLRRVGQLRPGDQVQFELVTLACARTLDTDFRRRWAVRLNQVLVHVRDGAKGSPRN